MKRDRHRPSEAVGKNEPGCSDFLLASFDLLTDSASRTRVWEISCFAGGLASQATSMSVRKEGEKKRIKKESSIFPWWSKGNVILVNKWCGEVEENKQTNKIIRSHRVAHCETLLAFKLIAALLPSRGKRDALQACLHCIVCQSKPVWHPKDNWRREEGQLLNNLSLLFAFHSSLTLFYSTLCFCFCVQFWCHCHGSTFCRFVLDRNYQSTQYFEILGNVCSVTHRSPQHARACVYVCVCVFEGELWGSLLIRLLHLSVSHHAWAHELYQACVHLCTKHSSLTFFGGGALLWYVWGENHWPVHFFFFFINALYAKPRHKFNT